MKTQIKYFIILFYLFVISNSCFSQNNEAERNVIWAHGLKKAADSWQLYADYFEQVKYPGKINTANVNYNTTNGGVNSALDLRHAIDNSLGSESQKIRNIAIGHNTGGLMMRYIDNNTFTVNRRYGGMINIGSPNKGMYLANSFVNGRLGDFTLEACAKLKEAPESEFVNASPEQIAEIEEICNLASVYTNNLLSNQTLEDLLEGAPFINNIDNAVNTSTHKLSIWGNENTPVHWRLFSAADEPPFLLDLDEVNDEEYVTRVADLEHYYGSNAFSSDLSGVMWSAATGALLTGILLDSQDGSLGAFIISAPFSYFPIGHLNSAHKFRQGLRWINHSEGKWLALIDAVGKNVTSTYTTTVNTCEGIPEDALHAEDLMLLGDCFEEQTFTMTQYVNERSDGLLKESTAKELKGRIADYEAEEANNEQLVNHPNVRIRLERIFDGEVNFFYQIAP